MFRYRLHSPDGDDLGEATYAMMIKPGEEIHGDNCLAVPRCRSRPVRRRDSRCLSYRCMASDPDRLDHMTEGT